MSDKKFFLDDKVNENVNFCFWEISSQTNLRSQNETTTQLSTTPGLKVRKMLFVTNFVENETIVKKLILAKLLYIFNQIL